MGWPGIGIGIGIGMDIASGCTKVVRSGDGNRGSLHRNTVVTAAFRRYLCRERPLSLCKRVVNIVVHITTTFIGSVRPMIEFGVRVVRMRMVEWCWLLVDQHVVAFRVFANGHVQN